ncbi:gamma-butyrobetaine hydroxylase-like domain-containing protein [Arsukibacterium sp.]|uniref:gamma-butyrobetaine hydroxylase-like domain-containing protein n=1 Tax=Arsukibacterium sp. TaxID=1977258 RepID=UPI00299CEB37|nr:gamma-butyrobetaine hydroxylase-like domain-containing protein [Arsukibacterium sp.]MDX1537520.1 gamma-butyrobetaine hydroxylase-like domain-containing protein [Arsukibacterium sp.]
MTLRTLHYHRQRRLLDLIFADGTVQVLSAEFLRVHSPSAEVRGHGKPRLVAHKRDVAIKTISPVGHYGVKLTFDDGHDTGLYHFRYLCQLADDQHTLWQRYLAQLKAANASRESLISTRQLS